VFNKILNSSSLFLGVPISKTQDSVGPICANVADIARVLQAIATPPPPVTLPDYLSSLSPNFLSENNIRIGIPRAVFCAPEILGEEHSVIMETFERTLEVLKSLGGDIVDPADIPNVHQVFQTGEPPLEEWRVMYAEFRVGLFRSFPKGSLTFPGPGWYQPILR
jgi:amidase